MKVMSTSVREEDDDSMLHSSRDIEDCFKDLKPVRKKIDNQSHSMQCKPNECTSGIIDNTEDVSGDCQGCLALLIRLNRLLGQI